MPLLDAVPSPLATLKAPPLAAALRPAAAIADPPDPLVPPPALTATTPARPAVDGTPGSPLRRSRPPRAPS